ncbi:MAG: DUF2723 domain-containing protein [Candidatus Delongbacteria bacterium]|jgi:hypothetical protein|nr:DUF2723 domain-containing protein [Candidatus Delongbacteria bacterium]
MKNYNEIKINRILGASVFLISLIIYMITVAPTTSFWDCGEFITTSYIMGIPHPPGAPFYLMLGRIFSMIPIVGDIGLRVNLISVIASSFTVLILYLTSVRLIKNWRGAPKDIYDYFIIHGSSVIGALTFAFTYTFWFNAVEAEVYALSMFFTAIIIWLTLVWAEKHQEEDSAKYILLLMLMVGLGTGVHLLNILTLPVIIFIMWFYDKRISIIVGSGVFISILVLFAFPLDVKIYSLFVFIFLTWIFQKSDENADVSLAFIMPLLLILGYSTYLMIYIRAGLNPPINENDPSNLERMMAYLNREQYGDEQQLKNAITMFFGETNRKYLESLQKMGVSAGSAGDPWKGHWTFFWKYQIVEMYIRYFNWQFVGRNFDAIKQTVSLNGLLAIPLFAGIWGALHHFFKDWKKATAIMALFIIMSLGLVIYQNQDWGQPRERDYFYVGSFFIFSIWIGMGITSIAEAFKDGKLLRKFIIPLVIIALIIPAMEIKANYFSSNRSGNYVAWDYSKNILESCDENAILFTNGDNDTFPVWYLQEVEGIRNDVVVVNLSLLNTGWYIKQLKKRIPEFVQYTDDEIKNNFDQKHMTQESFMKRYWPEPKKLQLPSKDKKSMVEWEMKPKMNVQVDGKPEGFLRIQDQMVFEMIVRNAINNWERPIYFAVTVASSNFIGLDEYMRMDGLCFRVVDYPADKGIEPEALYERVLKRYVTNYRNLDRKDIHYDDNIIRLLQNYRSAFLQLAIYYEENRVAGDTKSEDINQSKLYTYEEFKNFNNSTKIKYLLTKMEEYIPSDNIQYTSEMIQAEIAGMYMRVGNKKMGEKLLSNVDVSNMTFKKKIRFLIYSASKGYTDYSTIILEKVLKDIYKLNGKDKYEKLFELYAGFIQVDQSDLAEKIKNDIVNELKNSKDDNLRNSIYKEFAVVIYQGGDIASSKKILLEYLELNTKDTEALNLLFQIYSIDKEHSKALEIVNKYLEVDSTSKDFQDHKIVLEKVLENEEKFSIGNK